VGIKRLFVANRGEIAVRILRTARRLGIETVLGVSDADRHGMGAEMADRAVVLGPAPSAKSYLDVKLVVHAWVRIFVGKTRFVETLRKRRCGVCRAARRDY
jgi:acetyl-CoA carboxylase, biotin carboxylase subunit